MAKQWGEKTFKLSNKHAVRCWGEDTRYGFRHLATLYTNGYTSASAKCCYYNRTWESYTFQSVLHDVIHANFDKKQAKRYINKVDGIKEENSMLKSCAMIAALGDLMCEKPEEKTAWKKRFIEKVPGIIMPEDFDTLPEAEKQRRLDGAINIGLNNEVEK